MPAVKQIPRFVRNDKSLGEPGCAWNDKSLGYAIGNANSIFFASSSRALRPSDMQILPEYSHVLISPAGDIHNYYVRLFESRGPFYTFGYSVGRFQSRDDPLGAGQ